MVKLPDKSVTVTMGDSESASQSQDSRDQLHSALFGDNFDRTNSVPFGKECRRHHKGAI